MVELRIRVRNLIDERWSEWLGGLAVSHTEEGETVLTGTLPDQPALYGLLSKLRDLGLELLTVEVSGEAAAEAGRDASEDQAGSRSDPRTGSGTASEAFHSDECPLAGAGPVQA